jgi:hypothetical protein
MARRGEIGEGGEGDACAAVRGGGAATRWFGGVAAARLHSTVVWRASALIRPKMSVADHVARKAAPALRSTRGPTHGAPSHCRESRPG